MMLKTPKMFVLFVLSSLFATLFTSLFAEAAVAERFEAGVHYEVLPIPVQTADADKVEVVEVFSYGCVHCFTFDPTLEAWRREQAEDVDFKRLPATFNQMFALMAQAFYAAEVLEVSEKVHGPIFKALHEDMIDLRDPNLMAELFAREAQVAPDKFNTVFHSFSVRSRVQQADGKSRAFRITGVPSLVVNGKYRVDGRMAGNNTRMLQVVDYLIERERAAAAPVQPPAIEVN